MNDHNVIQAMSKFGGHFVQHLAEAAMHADTDNLERIKNTWPEYWNQYSKMAERNQTNNEIEQSKDKQTWMPIETALTFDNIGKRILVMNKIRQVSAGTVLSGSVMSKIDDPLYWCPFPEYYEKEN